ncbi:hypothetical protein [Chromobacterium piscinae]|uniref:hypothetical protein n=1 Tax=Chromobacterium piscinae TaxID=686831 RepID=UPI00325FE863
MLLLKLLLVPALIWLISAAARKWGPGVAGALAGFPVITGSILLILTLEQGPDFARQAALASAMGAAANVVFGIAYSWAALRWRWPLCLPLGVAGYALAVAGGAGNKKPAKGRKARPSIAAGHGGSAAAMRAWPSCPWPAFCFPLRPPRRAPFPAKPAWSPGWRPARCWC